MANSITLVARTNHELSTCTACKKDERKNKKICIDMFLLY